MPLGMLVEFYTWLCVWSVIVLYAFVLFFWVQYARLLDEEHELLCPYEVLKAHYRDCRLEVFAYELDENAMQPEETDYKQEEGEAKQEEEDEKEGENFAEGSTTTAGDDEGGGEGERSFTITGHYSLSRSVASRFSMARSAAAERNFPSPGRFSMSRSVASRFSMSRYAASERSTATERNAATETDADSQRTQVEALFHTPPSVPRQFS